MYTSNGGNTMYLVITKASVSIPGDERSRTNPGHGYPAHTEHYDKVEFFDEQSDFEARLITLKDRKTEYRAFSNAMELIPEFETTVKLNLK
jgi:hypothetical protein